MQKKMGLFSLVLLMVTAIDSVRNFPSAAIFGSSLVFFFLLAAAIFLVPVAFVSAAFSTRGEEGGVFAWVKEGLGETAAMGAVWLQWINTMVWYPTILCFIAGTASYLIDPALATKKEFLALVTLSVFWFLTLINLRGIHVSSKINSFCGILGLFLPMAILIACGFAWIGKGCPIQIEFSNILPKWDGLNSWISLVAIMASFLGMELAGVHMHHIKDAKRTFPKALLWAVIILLLTMIFGSLSIAIVIPKDEIRLVDGLLQTLSQFFAAFQMPYLTKILALLVMVGSLGNMINWLLAPARGLMQLSVAGFLPVYFAKTNAQDVPVRLLLIQAGLVSLFSLAIIFMPSINTFYWFLTDLSTALYMLMYLLLFASAYALRIHRLMSLFGMASSCLTILLAHFAPNALGIAEKATFAFTVFASLMLLTLPTALLYAYRKKNESLQNV